ncbi:alkaline phosphatase family protein [Horticoccus sp. 23ND18S-11]|uniref:alkaline phosphatase family protein n=1 Tax=Horticoccus sp. 23ND18S-11 TaxID=3391832 RepID=UPI0039C8E0BE
MVRFAPLCRTLAVVLAAGGCVLRAAEPPAPPPALVVVITVDQFRGDYPARFREHLVPGGLNLLLQQGANFVDCRYQHAVTKTAAGHAVVLTGVHANVHGIINNAWVERETLKRVNCVDDDSVEILGRADDRGSAKLPGTTVPIGASPRRLLATTVGDQLKLTRGGRSKVIGISSKDRSAILLAGKFADAAYWMDKGRMVTSTHYMRELPAWVRAFNDAGRVDSFFGRTWDRILPAAAYDALQGPDDAPGEFGDFGLGQTFPRRVNGGAEKITPAYYDAFELTPYKSEVLVDFARTVIEQEKLGQRGVTDLLCLSFSVNDSVGHAFGPDSHEVMDITVRTDRMLAELFAFLDARVGLKRCTIVFTADHGVAPIPEQVKARSPGVSAGRIDNARLLKTCEAALDRAFGPLSDGRHWLVVDESSLLFLRGVLQEKKVAQPAAEKVVRDALLTLEFVEAAYTRSDLEAGVALGPYGVATLLSFNRERSGDLYYQMKPYWVDRKTGTNHGAPYTYDTHVPLLWFGAGITPGVRTERVGVDDIAPTLARLLGLVAPPMSQGRVLF